MNKDKVSLWDDIPNLEKKIPKKKEVNELFNELDRVEQKIKSENEQTKNVNFSDQSLDEDLEVFNVDGSIVELE